MNTNEFESLLPPGNRPGVRSVVEQSSFEKKIPLRLFQASLLKSRTLLPFGFHITKIMEISLHRGDELGLVGEV
jgi:hypothetical protein